jgi:hypothetical protein
MRQDAQRDDGVRLYGEFHGVPVGGDSKLGLIAFQSIVCPRVLNGGQRESQSSSPR